MFEIVEGAVPAGADGRIDLFVKRDEVTGDVVATWDRVGVSIRAPHRVRRVETLGMPVADAYRQDQAAAREADVPLCIIDEEHLFPMERRPVTESNHEA